jgi:hypothetical protein
MSVHHLNSLDRLDRTKVRQRRRKLRSSVADWHFLAPAFPDGRPNLRAVPLLGLIIPVSPLLVDVVCHVRDWPQDDLHQTLVKRSGWFYCPELDVFASWSDSNLVTVIQNTRGSDTLRPS